MATVEEIADRLDREIDKRERANKYTHNMLEDIKTMYANFRWDMGQFKGTFDQHVTDDKRMSVVVESMKSDIETIKRLVWIGVGGVVVLAGLIGILAHGMRIVF